MADGLTFEIKRGDTAPVFRAQCLNGVDPVNLTTASAVKLLIRDRAGTVLVNAAMTKEDQTSNPGWVRRTWQTADTATAGVYRLEVEVTWADGTTQTFPPDRYATLAITEDLG